MWKPIVKWLIAIAGFNILVQIALDNVLVKFKGRSLWTAFFVYLAMGYSFGSIKSG